ncbi:hypothetical protein [Actinomadura rudentiformis]|uniref:Uncharacterized protein n=1 Tax=Actinomadura rudentiformis TaxID=359158 RepID=A0A6H9YAB7_9ACTN|nr:hypothetical protein [Actinomadura rudentiformis]KAB2342131.1 hypothetical protein F8566_39385 [Actinomadura rudentiformis]
MRFGPRDSPQSDDPDEPGSPEPPTPHPGDIHVAGRKGESPDWEPVQPRPETNPAPGPGADSEPPEGHEPPQIPEPPPMEPQSEPPPAAERPVSELPAAEPPRVPSSDETWTAYEPQHASEAPPPPAGRGGPLAKDPPPSTTAPDVPIASGVPIPSDVPTVPDVPDVLESPRPVEPTWAPPARPAPEVSMTDPGGREALVDTFVSGFVDSAIWQATLAVLEGAFPGLGLAAMLTRRADELQRTMDSLQDGGAARLGLPAWVDEAGMVFDLSAHLNIREEPASKPRASWPYAGAFVIDTLDPLRYHRAVGGPLAPRDPAQARPQTGEGDDTGVVIVADLTKARVRVLDSAALWRYAGQIVVATLYDPLLPETRTRTRRTLRALQRVVFIDPRLGLGLCLQVDVVRTPRCLLAFRVDSGAPRFVRP